MFFKKKQAKLFSFSRLNKALFTFLNKKATFLTLSLLFAFPSFTMPRVPTMPPMPTIQMPKIGNVEPTKIVSQNPTPTHIPAQTVSPTQTQTQPTQAPTKTPAPTQKSTSAPSPTTRPTAIPTQVQTSSVQTYIINEVNKYRAQNGLSAVKTDLYTCSFAKVRAKEISTDFSHNGFTSRVQNHTLPYPSYSYINENIAMTSDYHDVATMWANSPGHAANMRANTPYVCVEQYGNYFAYEGWRP